MAKRQKSTLPNIMVGVPDNRYIPVSYFDETYLLVRLCVGGLRVDQVFYEDDFNALIEPKLAQHVIDTINAIGERLYHFERVALDDYKRVSERNAMLVAEPAKLKVS